MLSSLELLISTDSTQQLNIHLQRIVPIQATTDSHVNIADIVTVSSTCANGLEASYQPHPRPLVDMQAPSGGVLIYLLKPSRAVNNYNFTHVHY